MRKAQILSVLACLSALACNKPSAEGESATAAPEPSVPAAPPSAVEPPAAKAPEPPAVPPSQVQPEPAAQPTTPPEPAGVDLTSPARAGGLTWTDPAGLVRRAPKSSMRAAEYGVPGDDLAELTVFYFGEGQGGAIEPNIARWIGQFSQPDGSDTAKLAKRREIQVKGMKVSIVEAKGTYSGGMGMPGMPAGAGQTDAMLLGAIAGGPKGPVFFKLTGARKTLERARPAFDKLIKSLRPE
jgi:hypothetical protein